jgi:hypothetical protein
MVNLAEAVFKAAKKSQKLGDDDTHHRGLSVARLSQSTALRQRPLLVRLCQKGGTFPPRGSCPIVQAEAQA